MRALRFSLFIFLPTAFCNVRAICTHPSVRKEWRQMTVTERSNWVSAVNVSARDPYIEYDCSSFVPTFSAYLMTLMTLG